MAARSTSWWPISSGSGRVAELKRELILSALASLLALPRNVPLGVLEAGVPHQALHDGETELVEELINPPIYEWTMTPTIFVAIEWPGETSPDAAVADLLGSLATVLEEAGSLGDLVTAIRPMAPDFAPKSLWGAANIKGAELPVEIDYWSESSLG